MSASEEVILFECGGCRLVGVMHGAANAHSKGRRVAIVNVVGGPQYRVGSHRQFVQMARRLAAEGYPVFRFDYRGMGDSEGDPRSFETISDDIESAIGVVRRQLPGHAIVLLGLCDGASAILMRSPPGNSVDGVVLLNPWVRTEASVARAYTRHYYGARLLSFDFWRRLVRFEWNFRESIGSFARNLRQSQTEAVVSFVERMRVGFAELVQPVLVVLSEHDLTAREFEDFARDNPAWTALMRRSNVRLVHLVGADHTLSSPTSLEGFISAVLDWLIRTGDPADPSGIGAATQ